MAGREKKISSGLIYVSFADQTASLKKGRTAQPPPGSENPVFFCKNHVEVEVAEAPGQSFSSVSPMT